MVLDPEDSLPFKVVLKLDSFEEMGQLESVRIQLILMFLSFEHDLSELLF